MDLNKLSDELNRKQNNQAIDDFAGFSPIQMHNIIYDPFGLFCPIKMYVDFELKKLRLSPIFNISFSLLNFINEQGKIKLTAKGNLPRRLINTIYDEGFLPDKMIEKGIIKLRQENDWLILHTLHLVLKLAGLLRKKYGYLLLTKKAQKYLSEGNESNLFLHLFENYSMKFNWGYNDGYDIDDIGQIGFLFLLYLLKINGTEFRELSFYSNLYFKAFPTFLDNYQQGDDFHRRSPYNALSIRFFERFAYWFGFIEYKGSENLTYSTKNVKMRKSDLLDSLFR